MAYEGPLDWIPLPLFLAGSVAGIFAGIEAGYQFGRFRRGHIEDEKEGPVGAAVAATMALLGFILAFTFSLAANRFQDRRVVLVDEDNAIGTCYLRAGTLPDDRGPRVRRILREYVDDRLEVVRTKNVEQLLQRTDELHGQLWKEAEACGRDHPDSIVAGLFIQSVNETIDVHSRRVLVALQNRLPLPLWISLIAATLMAMSGVGYHKGLSKSRRSPAIVVLVLTFSVVIALIADLDRPQDGWLRVSQQTTIELRKMMDREP